MNRFFKTTFYDGDIPTPKTIEVVEGVGLHQMVKMHFAEPYVRRRIREGSPVMVEWGSREPRVFLGYVNSFEDVAKRDVGTSILCVGATRPLKSAQHNTWENATLSQVFRRVTKNVNLSSEVVGDDLVYPSLQQPGDLSAWEFLAKKADEAGLLLIPDQVTVRAVSSAALKPGPGTPVISTHAEYSTWPVHTLESVRGQASARGGREATRMAFNLTDEGTPLGDFRRDSRRDHFREMPVRTGSTRDQIRKELDRESRRNRLTEEIDVKGAGTGKYYPGRYVKLEKTDSSLDGYWLITWTHHVVKTHNHEVHMVAKRSGREPRGRPSPYRQQRARQRTGRVEGRLTRQRWTA